MLKKPISIFILIGVSFGLINCTSTNEEQGYPNIIVFLADDLGYGDLGCYGCTDIRTPNIDKVADEGVRFTQFYSNGPECTPTRVAFLTGRYQQRTGGLECAIGAGNVGRYNEAEWLANQGELGLPNSENNLLSKLKEKGYQSALIGKWHLGYEKKFRPVEHGFDYSFGPIGYGGDYFFHTEQVEIGMDDLTGMHTLMENNKEVFYEGEYFTNLFTKKALEWLKDRKKNQPFFLYLPYTAPHTPYQGPGDKIERPLRADEWNRGNRETYIEMVESLDKGVGQILAFLKEHEMEKETLVIFFSDNGGAKNADNGPFSGRKGSVFEGGIHVPCIVKWPGKIEKGIHSDQTCISFDLTRSLLAILNENNEQTLDGYDILNHVSQGIDDFDRTLFWRSKRGNRVRKAVRMGNLKYISRIEDDSLKFEKLYNLEKDPAELEDLGEVLPDKLDEIRKELKNWELNVKAPRLRKYNE